MSSITTNAPFYTNITTTNTLLYIDVVPTDSPLYTDVYTTLSVGNQTATLPMCSVRITEEIHLDKTNNAVFTNIFMPSFIFTLLMFLIGGPGNTLVFYVYFVKWRRTTARIFILALAGFDMVNCFLTMPMEMGLLINIIKFDYGPVCKCFRYVTFMMNNGSSVVLSGIAIDRYIRICLPFRSPLRTKHAKIVVIIASVLSVAFAWPALLLYGTQTVPLPVPGKPHVCIIGKTCLYEDRYAFTNYPLIFTLALLIGNLIIDTGLITLYSLIGYQVIKTGTAVKTSPTKKYRKGGTSTMSNDDNHLDNKNPENRSKKREMFRKRSPLSISTVEARRSQMYKTTFMLFMVTILFMVSFIPYCAIVIIRSLNADYYNNLSTAGKAVHNLLLRTYMLSSSLNPVIYCFISIQFRQQCKEILKRILVCHKRG